MTLNSIRVRLLFTAALMIVLALLAMGAAMTLIFQRHLEKRVGQELDKHFTQLVAVLEVAPSGTLTLDQDLTDPRFNLPLSGLYWQIDLESKPVLRSRSLWDQQLTVPTPPKADDEAHVHELPGPDNENLYSLEKAVFLNHLGQEKLFVVTVGLARSEISDSVLSMTKDVAPTLLALGLVLLLATALQVTLGLKPLSLIRDSVQGIREGRMARMNEVVADEVKPLVQELNGLLNANESRTKIARQRAADLAHGLRTPLTILGALSRTVQAAGLTDEAEKIRLQTEHMRQQVERELASVMSDAEERPEWIDVETNVRRLVKIMAMGTAQEGFAWNIDVAKDVQWRISRNDFNEILGNILENAQKWAKTRVNVKLNGVHLIVEDDGPGAPDADIQKLTERGFTTGDTRTSSGLGLAIVQQLTNKNGIGLELGRGAMGGLEVTLNLAPISVRQKSDVNLPNL